MSESSVEYSLPGVLHYLQAQWRKFEREKNEWAIERAELQARIALLEGERRGVENIKLTMMKRVKMLEYALRQERKRHAGVTTTSEGINTATDDTTTDATPITNTNDSNENINIPIKSDTTSNPSIVDNKMKEKSREVLKSCLQEINYLTSFSSKLPLTNALTNSTNRSAAALNERSPSIRRAPPPPSGNTNSPVLAPASLAAASSTSKVVYKYPTTPDQSTKNYKYNSTNKDKSVLSAASPRKNNNATFVSSPIPKKSSLQYQQQQQQEEDEDEDNMEVPANVDEVAMINNIKEETENYNNTHRNASMTTSSLSPSQQQQENNESLSMQIQEKFHLSEEKVAKLLKHATGSNSKSKSLQQEDRLLAGDFDPNQIRDIDGQQQIQPKIWKTRVTIKGHLDSVRAVCFHPNEMTVASGSDDGTVKIWNLQSTTGKDGTAIKKGSLEEADPSITFRGHTNVVTAVAISAKQNKVYSASLDSTIRVWSLPSDDRGPFAPVDSSLNIATYVGHTDAIWDFKLSQDHLLASASADGTVKIWDTESSGNLLKSSWTFDGISTEEGARKERVAPTSLDFCPTDPNKVVVSFANAKIRMYDIETGQVLMTFKGSDDTFDNTFATQINRVVAHPTLPIIISGHEDRHIKFFDINTGECTQSVSGHLDAVTSLDIDSTGNIMVSGGHDSSIRLWDLTNKTCLQEFSAHRRKGDEGVLSVKFHRSFPWMVSGGADGIVKIYHHGH